MFKITDQIYQGGQPRPGDRFGHEWAIVSLMDDVPLPTGCLPAFCRSVCYIPDGDFPGIKWLEMVIAIIENYLKHGRKVYIHCYAGISRSVMLTAAYLMKERGWTRDVALNFIAQSNRYLDPNPHFLKGLLEWEEHLREG